MLAGCPPNPRATAHGSFPEFDCEYLPIDRLI
jgi:hypothetical protein